ncbi:MAG TPA: flavodoxin domain-containing protein [Clostridia bacterium]|nr:flavodoxin domain-containing protein [Clostridia bacterium]
MSSRESGNTFNVCQHVSSNSDVELQRAAKTDKQDLSPYDAIILASGVYINHVHINILKWIKSIETNTITSNTKFYLFLTWFGRGDSDKAAIHEVKHLLGEKGIKLEDNYMKCFGKGMGVVRSAHPNEEDFKSVLLWANGL